MKKKVVEEVRVIQVIVKVMKTVIVIIRVIPLVTK